MNVQHSSRTDQWYTPVDILDRARVVLGQIDLDPASDEFGNSRVGATRYLTDGLNTPWPGAGTVFLNPPGGKLGNKSKAALFWTRLVQEYEAGNVTEAIFLAFSAEALQNTQGKGVRSIGEFPLCVPAKRLHFDAFGGLDMGAPSHSNLIAYLPSKTHTQNHILVFRQIFQDLGLVIVPEHWIGR